MPLSNNICGWCEIYYSPFPYNPSIYNQDYEREFTQRYYSDFGILLRERRQDLVQKFILPTDQVLDIGCGLGSVCPQAMRIDPIFWPRTNWPIADVTLFFDSFEHFEAPWKVLQTVNPQTVIMSIPIFNGRMGDIYQWKHFKPVEHLILFSRRGLYKYVSACGYDRPIFQSFEEGRMDVETYVFQKLKNSPVLYGRI